jgi:hypothetical protein
MFDWLWFTSFDDEMRPTSRQGGDPLDPSDSGQVTGAVESPAGTSSLVPDLVEGAVPERLPGAVVREPLVDATPDTFLMRIPPAGRFLVRGGDPVRVRRAPGATDADVRCFLEGPVAAVAALLRGLVPLRAATVVIRGRAVAIAGASATGKSTLAAALALRGHAVLADAVTPIATDAGAATPTVHPHAPDPVLWPDMVAELGLDPAAGRIVRPALPKLAFRLGADASPAPLGAVVFLRRDARAAPPRPEKVEGTDKVTPLANAGWHHALAGPLGMSPRRFAALAGIASASSCIVLPHSPGGASPAELAALVEEVVR